MIKRDRGTVLFIRVHEKENSEPFIIDITSNGFAGIVLDSSNLIDSFEEGALDCLKADSIGLIKKSGELVSIFPNLSSISQLDKIELTVVYPDGTAKISERKGNDLSASIIWEESLIEKIKGINSSEIWTENWRNNPAIIILRDGMLSTGCQQMSGC